MSDVLGIETYDGEIEFRFTDEILLIDAFERAYQYDEMPTFITSTLTMDEAKEVYLFLKQRFENE